MTHMTCDCGKCGICAVDLIKRLQARVAELEYWLLMAISGKPVRNADEVLARKPSVSLPSIKARVAELEEALADYAHHPHTCPAWGDPDLGECDCGCEDVLKVLDRTPAQSLASIKVQTLREACSKYLSEGGTRAGTMWFEAEADRIEQEAREK